jgi:hypothetical protein
VPAGSAWNVVPENIAYGDLEGDGREEAFVPLFANACGGTMITGERVLVYTLRGDLPTALPEFDYVDEGCEEGEECGFTRSPIPPVEYDAPTHSASSSSCCRRSISLSKGVWTTRRKITATGRVPNT